MWQRTAHVAAHSNPCCLRQLRRSNRARLPQSPPGVHSTAAGGSGPTLLLPGLDLAILAPVHRSIPCVVAKGRARRPQIIHHAAPLAAPAASLLRPGARRPHSFSCSSSLSAPNTSRPRFLVLTTGSAPGAAPSLAPSPLRRRDGVVYPTLQHMRAAAAAGASCAAPAAAAAARPAASTAASTSRRTPLNPLLALHSPPLPPP